MLPGPIPEHPAPASRSGQDSHVSRAAPWVGWGAISENPFAKSRSTQDSCVSKGGPLNDLGETNF